MAPLPEITILGSLNMDLVSYVPHHPLPGETLTSSSFSSSPGGKGANQAVACAKLSRSSPAASASASASPAAPSAKVTMVGAVGDDAHGSVLLESLSSYGVDTSRVLVREGRHTGIAVIVVDEPSGQNRIILSPESNATLVPGTDYVAAAPAATLSSASPHSSSNAPSAAAAAQEKGDSHHHHHQQQQQQQQEGGEGKGPSRPNLLIMQLEIPLPTVLEALQTAKVSGIPVLLNPAPAQPLPDAAYRGLAHLIVNETEASILSGTPVEELLAEDDNDDDSSSRLAAAAAVFLDKGVENVVITLGARGVFYASRATGRQALVAAVKTHVVDTTAAGDTFVGSYALAVVQAAAAADEDRTRDGKGGGSGGGGFDIDAAVRAANRASSVTVSRKGAQASIPWRDEL
ncbi:ribokinase [Moelleriella libera RCEF 2490]|uniref:Ribokinase n=1 Tax=Moelleriella libera RCEF 2490 TaxID=1081109 RepID=A0A162K2Q3_9HYPO|nr:ribokinase [Moelleriella libera RCEF 2490]